MPNKRYIEPPHGTKISWLILYVVFLQRDLGAQPEMFLLLLQEDCMLEILWFSGPVISRKLCIHLEKQRNHKNSGSAVFRSGSAVFRIHTLLLTSFTSFTSFSTLTSSVSFTSPWEPGRAPCTRNQFGRGRFWGSISCRLLLPCCLFC